MVEFNDRRRAKGGPYPDFVGKALPEEISTRTHDQPWEQMSMSEQRAAGLSRPGTNASGQPWESSNPPDLDETGNYRSLGGRMSSSEVDAQNKLMSGVAAGDPGERNESRVLGSSRNTRRLSPEDQVKRANKYLNSGGSQRSQSMAALGYSDQEIESDQRDHPELHGTSGVEHVIAAGNAAEKKRQQTVTKFFGDK